MARFQRTTLLAYFPKYWNLNPEYAHIDKKVGPTRENYLQAVNFYNGGCIMVPDHLELSSYPLLNKGKRTQIKT